jgi:hypothetical protein
MAAPPRITVNSRRTSHNSISRWLPAGAAGGLLVAVVAAGLMSGDGNGGNGISASTSTIVAVAAPPPTDPVATINPEDQIITETTDVAIEKVPLDRTLGAGVVGDDVRMVQERLSELAFDPGPIDGIYGDLTKQAVWAFEKLVMGVPRAEATGKVTAEMWSRLQDPIVIQPRRPTGGLADHTEIYLPEQVMIVFHGDAPALVAHISSGELAAGADGFTPWQVNAAEYCETVTIDTDDNGNLLEEPIEKAICGRSYTPPGVFEAYRKVEGRRESRLGGMYNPIYINQGIAIHGALNVPLQPASHGCIRVSQYLGSNLQSILDLGDRVLIWDGVTEPEQQSAEAMKMRWDYPDPNATTTTSTSTTTTTTTVAPAITAAPTTVATATTMAPTTTTPTTTTTTTTTEPPATTTTSTTEPPDG